ncbi:MAG TPA: pyridoxine 5'-phosphate synthase [Flavobacteriales bacterium]|nr:pyridoxine 5'-phosphate synthase [Flavobacteriales bacterium]HIO68517.1 pyridoxine 5'-phosphate synthase [Flavobacteriales bacterium]
MIKLSVNINKVATIRNARGGNTPNLIEVAKDCQQFGAQGITVHPRPDQRHIKYEDAFALPDVINTEYNIEGNPTEDFMKMVLKIKPTQVTLVPDSVDVLTSNAGWDTIVNETFLTEIIGKLKAQGIRTSIFIETELKNIQNAKKTGTDRIELYTEDYAHNYAQDKELAIKPFLDAAVLANELGLGINAGHDLNLENLNYFARNIPGLLEVSIGHALISDALYYGLQSTIQLYLKQLEINKS